MGARGSTVATCYAFTRAIGMSTRWPDVNIDARTSESVPRGLGRMDSRSLLARKVVLVIHLFKRGEPNQPSNL